MTGAFYLTATETFSGTWYMLMTRETHFCVSCGEDLERRLQVLKSYMKRYRTEQRLLDSLERLDCGGKVSPITFQQREDYYQEHGKDYEDLVHSTVLEAFAEAREEDKKNNPFRKTKERLNKVSTPKSLVQSREVSPKEDSTPREDSQKILRKPRVFNHK